MDKNWIDKKIVELKDEICLQANVSLPLEYQLKDDFLSKTEASVAIDGWRMRIFPIAIFPSFFRLRNEKAKENVLRHELMHIKDALDPKFNYDGGLSVTGEFSGNLSNLIWEISIDMRLKKKGFETLLTYEDRINDFKEFLRTPPHGYPEYESSFELDLSQIEQIVKNNKLTCSTIKNMVESELDKRNNFMARLSVEKMPKK